ncbi:hypothetical protein PXJ20_31980 [Paraburkholderia sp. A1RI_3L]|uniref:hypothetical protein n=1 Tax=Paraburkholderia TaxID=1822464 RepID=UPI003B815846
MSRSLRRVNRPAYGLATLRQEASPRVGFMAGIGSSPFPQSSFPRQETNWISRKYLLFSFQEITNTPATHTKNHVDILTCPKPAELFHPTLPI